ncbi:unnamed protein product [Microthlaspi erraticum]|uniref:SURP motif domain-containing protein n=1 Tax=Microthlaspi erraticum TaxID=1685480 RepID=A0A6D2IL42_9BRAS|nr:unnamed protein product [Microthlaspi erraticum]
MLEETDKKIMASNVVDGNFSGANIYCVAIPDIRIKLEAPLMRTLTFPDDLTRKELGVIQLTAQFVARYGNYFLLALVKKTVKDPQFGFMRSPDHKWFRFFNELLSEYGEVTFPCNGLKGLSGEKASAFFETLLKGLFTFLAWQEEKDVIFKMTMVEYVWMELNKGPLRVPHKLALAYPKDMSREELGVVDLTAQFVARYGDSFLSDLMKRTVKDRKFDFMNCCNRWFGFFSELHDEYCRKIVLWEDLKRMSGDKASVFIETLVQALFTCLEWQKEKDVIFKMTMSDWFSIEWESPEEPEPKRQKFDESALVAGSSSVEDKTGAPNSSKPREVKF